MHSRPLVRVLKNFLVSQPKHVVGTQKNRLNEMVLLSTQNYVMVLLLKFGQHVFAVARVILL